MTRAAFRLLLFLCLLPPLLPTNTLAQLGGDPVRYDPFARVQFIHNVTDIGPLDIYLDGTLWLDDFDYRKATAFELLPNGTHRFDIVDGVDANNDTPLWTSQLTVLNTNRYVLVAQGYASNLQLVLRQNVRAASFSGDPEFFIIHGSPTSGPIDVRLMDPSKGNAIVSLMQNNLIFGQSGIYYHLPPAEYNFEITTADNRLLLNVFHFNLSSFFGQTFVMLVSGTGRSTRNGFALIAYDEKGNPVSPTVTTASTDSEALPSAFRLDPNYPNPFNPATQITYAVPYPAAVRLHVYDMLGRLVRTLIHATQPMGTYTVTWDGRDEAGTPVSSGTYLYRLEAGEHVQTRTMQLLK